MKVVGLGHYSRTGKDSFANAMVRWFDANTKLKAKKIPFAWKLKQICFELYAWDGLREPEFYDTKEGEPFRDIMLPRLKMTPVETWIAMGTPAVRQNVYANTWIDYLLRSDHQCDVLIIPDVRFPNEVDAIRELEGTLHKIVRPGYGPRNTIADKELLGYMGWDYIWGADGDFHNLEQSAFNFAASIAGMGETPVQTHDYKRQAMSVEKAVAA